MKIFCLIPVHNRFKSTKDCLDDILNQDFEGDIEIVVIDDGSTDGTNELLSAMSRVDHGTTRRMSVIVGDGTWWWSKCINSALSFINDRLAIEDGVLLLNDDVRLKPTYLRALAETWRIHGQCVVMSQLVNVEAPHEQIPSPIRIDPTQLVIEAVQPESIEVKNYSDSDLAPGRGTLYPAELFMEGMRVNEDGLPHYLADYELSARARSAGMKIICAHQAHVLTTRQWGNERRRGGLRWRIFAKESPDRLAAYWGFWRVAEPSISISTLVFRILRYRVIPAVFESLGQRS